MTSVVRYSPSKRLVEYEHSKDSVAHPWFLGAASQPSQRRLLMAISITALRVLSSRPYLRKFTLRLGSVP